MDKPIGTYSFLPYLRVGLANKTQQADQDAAVKLRATFHLELTLEGKAVEGGGTVTEVVAKDVELYGPGDVVGIDSRAIIKNEPHNWITNFEPNYLPYIDFYDEDFPWRYTPSKAAEPAHRLRPWLALVVLEEGEFTDGKNLKDKPLPFIHVESAATKFLPPEQLWAWAHVHVNRDLAATNEEVFSENMGVVLPKLDAALKENPDFGYSRIICPRKLKPSAAYHAFLIPSFESGRQAGLGLDVNPDFASQYSWGQKPDQLDFPYYHRWYFRTSTVGDFEYLVRLLKAQPADERVGRRDMDVQEPGWNLPGLHPDGELGGILKLGGALRVPDEVLSDPAEFYKYEDWLKTNYPQPINEGIATFVNLADDYQKPGTNPQPVPDPENALDPDPLITPPLYGRWHAAVDRLLFAEDGTTPVPNNKNWIHELNLDPRFRVPAGFGTKVIQEHQEAYMNAAWQQVGDVVKANHFIRLAQLSQEALYQWHVNHFQPLWVNQPDKLMLLTAPVQKRILVQNATVFYQMKMSLVPPVAISPQLRKITRPRSRVVKQLPFEAKHLEIPSIITRLNEGEIVPAPPKITPPAIKTEQVLIDQTTPHPKPEWLAKLLKKYKWLPWATLGLAVVLLILLLIFSPAAPLYALGLAVVGGLVWLWRLMTNILKQLAQPEVFTENGQTPEQVDAAPKSPDFRITEVSETFQPKTGATDSPVAVRFKTALKEMYAVDVAAKRAAFLPAKRKLDLPTVTSGVVTTLHPDKTIPRLVLDRILLPGRIKFIPEKFDQIMEYPKFNIPMYEPLVKLSDEYFLPNINLIPNNSITLLETNQKFIESYMVGINHEMSRELLWREYPTDQRGSYFRQFWDVSAYLPEQGEDLDKLEEKLKDIPEIHKWSRFSKLGDHDNREVGGANEEEVVLVIRGELLKKYPTAVIYAHKAKWQTKNADGTGGFDPAKERDLFDIPEGQENNPPRTIVKTPLYSAKVDPDIYFFGFDLTSEVAKGNDGTNPQVDNAGWFFVIKERPGEPRFGLDIGGPNAVKHTWSDLAWEDAAPGLPEGGFLQITNATPTINLTAPTDTTQAEYEEELLQHNEDKNIRWRKESDAADLAYILYQVPVMVAVHASEMLKPKGT